MRKTPILAALFVIVLSGLSVAAEPSTTTLKAGLYVVTASCGGSAACAASTAKAVSHLVTGTPKGETLTGGAGKDVLKAMGGAERIVSGAGTTRWTAGPLVPQGGVASARAMVPPLKGVRRSRTLRGQVTPRPDGRPDGPGEPCHGVGGFGCQTHAAVARLAFSWSCM
jgi:hypothetical protein